MDAWDFFNSLPISISKGGGWVKILLLQKNLYSCKKTSILAIKFYFCNILPVAFSIAEIETGTVRIAKVKASCFCNSAKQQKAGPCFCNTHNHACFFSNLDRPGSLQNLQSKQHRIAKIVIERFSICAILLFQPHCNKKAAHSCNSTI